MKKVYVVCGLLRWLCHAEGPLDATRKALLACPGYKLSRENFYIDERGFRVRTAQYRVPTSVGLKNAGFRNLKHYEGR